MLHQAVHIALLLVSFSLLAKQLWVQDKQDVHLIFAGFCCSLAIMSVQALGGKNLGIYTYLLGMGVCLTCNGYWLVARALFRRGPAICLQHILAAAVVGMLVVFSQGIALLQSLSSLEGAWLLTARALIGELLVLLSSTMLVLTLWEGLRGFSGSDAKERRHRILFLLSYGAALGLCTIGTEVFLSDQNEPLTDVVRALAALAVMSVTQVLIHWRFDSVAKITPLDKTQSMNSVREAASQLAPSSDRKLGDDIKHVLFEQELYLKGQLKVADLARHFDVPEYRISRVLRTHLAAKNFNHYINTLRVERAKELLADPQNHHWPVLVVGMESGFASVGPFLRAFKAIVGCTPNEYRQRIAEASTQ